MNQKEMLNEEFIGKKKIVKRKSSDTQPQL